MRDTVWKGKIQKMNFAVGVPKGMKNWCGIITTGLKEAADMKQILKGHDDFKNEKPKVLHFLEDKGHTAYFLPKFHCELNPIERVWGQAKRYSKAHCDYSFPSLRKVINPALDSVPLDFIRKYHRKSRDYMFTYFEGFWAGPKLEKQIKQYKLHRSE